MITVAIMINAKPLYARTAVRMKDPAKKGAPAEYHLDDGSIVHHDPDAGAVELAKRMLSTIKEI